MHKIWKNTENARMVIFLHVFFCFCEISYDSFSDRWQLFLPKEQQKSFNAFFKLSKMFKSYWFKIVICRNFPKMGNFLELLIIILKNRIEMTSKNKRISLKFGLHFIQKTKGKLSIQWWNFPFAIIFSL